MLPIQWTNRRKTVQLIVITLASMVPDFDGGIGETKVACGLVLLIHLGVQVSLEYLHLQINTIQRQV
jgi:hypothetical protein